MKKIKKFNWQGINIHGFKVSGSTVATSFQEAKTSILQQKITLLKIRRQFVIPIFLMENKIKDTDITAFCLEFSTLISAGIPLINALRILADSASKIAMKHLIDDIKRQIENGRYLSEIICSYEYYFGAFFGNLLQIGEHTGMLDVILNHLATYSEKIISLKKKIKKALFYPITVLIIALSVTCAMLIFVLPQFAQLFDSVGAELPALTQIVMQSAHILQKQGSELLFILITSIFLFKLGLRRFKAWQRLFACFWLNTPVVGKMLLEAIFARCFHALAITVKSGLPLMDSLQLIANVAGNHVYTQAFSNIGQCVKNGQTLSRAFKNTQSFPERVIQMITVGEESGRLDEMLQKLSDYFAEQVDYKVANLSQLLEPALMIFLCLIVGTLVIAMYLPIFRLGAVL